MMARMKDIPKQRQVKILPSKVHIFRVSFTTRGYHIDSSVTKTISKFPAPTNCTDLRSFFGLVNQLSSSTVTIMNFCYCAPYLAQRMSSYGHQNTTRCLLELNNI